MSANLSQKEVAGLVMLRGGLETRRIWLSSVVSLLTQVGNDTDSIFLQVLLQCGDRLFLVARSTSFQNLPVPSLRFLFDIHGDETKMVVGQSAVVQLVDHAQQPWQARGRVKALVKRPVQLCKVSRIRVRIYL